MDQKPKDKKDSPIGGGPVLEKPRAADKKKVSTETSDAKPYPAPGDTV